MENFGLEEFNQLTMTDIGVKKEIKMKKLGSSDAGVVKYWLFIFATLEENVSDSLFFIIFYQDMSRTAKKQDNKPKFDTTPYQRPGLTESDILEIKEVFDMFDREHCGSINPKGKH